MTFHLKRKGLEISIYFIQIIQAKYYLVAFQKREIQFNLFRFSSYVIVPRFWLRARHREAPPWVFLTGQHPWTGGGSKLGLRILLTDVQEICRHCRMSRKLASVFDGPPVLIIKKKNNKSK